MLRVLGDPDRVVNLRSAVKPFGLVALLEAGGRQEFDLSAEELAIMASQPLRRGPPRPDAPGAVPADRASARPCSPRGTEGMPLDALTAARLARDGERPGDAPPHVLRPALGVPAARQLGGWELETYWQDDHPAQVAVPRGRRRRRSRTTRRGS